MTCRKTHQSLLFFNKFLPDSFYKTDMHAHLTSTLLFKSEETTLSRGRAGNGLVSPIVCIILTQYYVFFKQDFFRFLKEHGST